MPEFKWQRLNLAAIKPATHGIELVAAEFDADLSQFDGILHKFTYDLADGHEPDVIRIADYVKTRPNFVVIEPIDNIGLFTNRLALQEFFHSHPLPPCVEYCDGVLLTPGIQLPFPFPALVKAVSACGTAESHSITVVHNPEQLDACAASPTRVIAFPFVPHSGTVFKVYSLGPHTISRTTGSLVITSSDSAEFDSQKPLPDALANTGFAGDAAAKLAPSQEELDTISAALRTSTGVELIGFDLLRRETDAKLVLVDFNYFPCFRGIDDISGKLAAFIKGRAGRG
jgi:glutathione synthase/RimK-type ligase-like ATP-grasp enzyme